VGALYHVVIAENEPWIRKAVIEMVERDNQDYKIVGEATNGEEAWALIQETWPTILITDIMMPEMDGLQLIHKVVETGIPMICIIISGFDNFQYAKQAITYGVSEYLLKPVEYEDFRAALLRSASKLEQFGELNSYLVRFQNYIDSMHKKDAKEIIRQLTEMVQVVLRLKHFNYGVRNNLLRIYDGKLKTLLRQLNVHELADFPASIDDDVSINRHFQALVEAWIIGYQRHSSTSMKMVIQDCCRYIDEHYDDDITLTEIADFAHMSISHFSTLFKQHTGQTLIIYTNQVRINEAKKLLASTGLKIYEIAEKVGFSSLPYFTRVFKQVEGRTPLEYRKSMGL
jgi:two-component system response regulator YesN